MGWLRKREPDGLSSSRRFFVLTRSEIRYYEKKPESLSDTSSIRGVIPYKNLTIGLETFSSSIFTSLQGSNKNFSIFLRTMTGKEVELVAETRHERDEWFSAISWFIERGGGRSGVVRNSAYNSLPSLKPRPHQSLPILGRPKKEYPPSNSNLGRESFDIVSIIRCKKNFFY